MELIAIVTMLAILEYFVFGYLVGQARGRFGVKAPATTGDPVFERYFRVHQNTLEQLVIFLPSLWFFGRYVSPLIGALLGLVFIAGRAVYARGYIEAPEKRGLGTLISFASSASLLVGALVGAALAWF